MPRVPKTTEFLKLARARFKQAEEADRAQRQRELDDLRFYAGDQWDPETRKSRAGQPAKDGLPPSPPRPCLVINKIREPVKQVTNEERQAEMGIELVAADDFGDLQAPVDDTEIELREGLIRKIQRDSDAQDARSWAFSRAVIAGRGYYGVMTRYLPGKTRDQEVYLHRFYNQASVSLDPTHERPDGSDAKWGFVGTDMPWDIYKAEHPRRANGHANRVATMTGSPDDWRALGDEAPGWFTVEGDTRSVRVVDYWYTEQETKSLATLEDGSIEWEDDLPQSAVITDRRPVVQQQIKWCKIDGLDDDALDETDWPGPDLPIVKVLGEELHPYDKERRVEGMTRPARDSNQGFNAMASKAVELVALNPIPPLMVAEGTTHEYEPWYQAMTTRTLPYVPYKTRDLEGNPAGPPTRAPLDIPYQPVFASLQMFDEATKSTTGKGDPELGHVDPSLKSGKVVEMLKKQSQHGTSHFMNNLMRSMRYEGQIINNLLFPIYGTPGRLVRIMTGEGNSQVIRLGQPSPPITRPMAPSNGNGQSTAQPTPVTYQLTKDANFNVIVKVVQSFNSKREQEALMIGDLLTANPMLMTWFGDLFFQNQDGPGHLDMADRAKVMLDPKIQAVLSAHAQGQQIPPAAMAQIAQLQKQVQDAEHVIQKAQQEIQGKQAEWAARSQIAKDDREFKGTMELEYKHMDNETKLAVAELGAKVDRLQLFLEESQLVGARAHEAAMGAADAGHDAGLQQQDHTNTLAQQQQAASLAPSPETTQPDQTGTPSGGNADGS